MSRYYGSTTYDDGSTTYDDGCLEFLAIAVVVTIIVLGGALCSSCSAIAGPIQAFFQPETFVQDWQWAYDAVKILDGYKSNIAEQDRLIADFTKLKGENASAWTYGESTYYQSLTSTKAGYISAYNQTASKYNAKMGDVSRAWKKPPDLPDCVPLWGAKGC